MRRPCPAHSGPEPRASMPRTEDGRAFTGQYRIAARARPEGMSLRLSLDADLLLRLVTDTGGPSLELAGLAPREAPTLSWGRHGLGIVVTLVGVGVALASLLWLAAPPREPAPKAPAPFTLPELPAAPQPSTLAPPAPPSEPPAPAVIRLEPVPDTLPTPLPPAPPRPRAAPPQPAAPKPALPPPAPKAAAERSAAPASDVLDLFDDTK